jgi:ubiquinone/menaquinone biosynthesis C-methylase UbiE
MQCARRLLGAIDADKAVDIPAGTGKMAEVLAEFVSEVVAIDVSPAMLKIARREYEAAGIRRLSVICAAAEDLERVVRKADVILCVRLLHRVPKEARQLILEAFSRVAPYAIVTHGVRSRWQSLRKTALDFLLRASDRTAALRVTPGEFESEVKPWFTIERTVWVLPFLSAERFALLRSRTTRS